MYCCPAVPTLLINGGARPPAASAGGGSQIFDFETGLMQLQLQMERSFIKIAQATGRPSIIVMDRGLLDVAACVQHPVPPPSSARARPKTAPRIKLTPRRSQPPAPLSPHLSLSLSTTQVRLA